MLILLLHAGRRSPKQMGYTSGTEAEEGKRRRRVKGCGRIGLGQIRLFIALFQLICLWFGSANTKQKTPISFKWNVFGEFQYINISFPLFCLTLQ